MQKFMIFVELIHAKRANYYWKRFFINYAPPTQKKLFLYWPPLATVGTIVSVNGIYILSFLQKEKSRKVSERSFSGLQTFFSGKIYDFFRFSGLFLYEKIIFFLFFFFCFINFSILFNYAKEIKLIDDRM